MQLTGADSNSLKRDTNNYTKLITGHLSLGINTFSLEISLLLLLSMLGSSSILTILALKSLGHILIVLALKSIQFQNLLTRE
jgi:hypothetical protein